MDEFLENLCEGIRTMPEENWVLLLAEYYELKEELPDPTILLSRDVTKLYSHLNLLEKVILRLRVGHNEHLLQAIKILGYPLKPSEKPEAYQAQLDAIVNRSKTKYIQLQQYIKQLDDAIKKIPSVAHKPKREYFEGLLIAFEEMQKVAYTLETMTVIKFTQLERKYWKFVDAHRRTHK